MSGLCYGCHIGNGFYGSFYVFCFCDPSKFRIGTEHSVAGPESMLCYVCNKNS